MNTRLKSFVKTQIRRVVDPGVRAGLPAMAATIQHIATIYPHQGADPSYTLPAHPGGAAFAIPPEEFRASYCTTDATYLASGRDDTEAMRRLLVGSGTSIQELGNVLELGVAGGRMIRHLTDIANSQEIWGVDHWASAILWCKEHLTPPFHFATTTVTPHLPFEDRYFGLVFAGSVWTHLDDLAEAWALEVRRILRPGGRFYFTINDRSAVKIFQGGGSSKDRERYIERIRPDNWRGWLEMLERDNAYQSFARGDVNMVTMGRSTQAHAMWDVDYLFSRLGPGWRLCSVTPEAYGHQTGVLLAKEHFPAK
jgi:SAM-dependent methyltransferase